jgi:hypothetical protein
MIMADDIIKEALLRFKQLLENAQTGQINMAAHNTEADLQLVRLALKKYNKRAVWRHRLRSQPNAGLSAPP